MTVVFLDFLLQQVNPPPGTLQAFVSAHNTDVVPHAAAQFVPVMADHHFFIRVTHP